jgi:hypothetical protein
MRLRPVQLAGGGSGVPRWPADRAEVREALGFMAHALEGSPSMASSYP